MRITYHAPDPDSAYPDSATIAVDWPTVPGSWVSVIAYSTGPYVSLRADTSALRAFLTEALALLDEAQA